MGTAVENAMNIFTVNRLLRRKEGNIRCLDEYKRLYGICVVLSTELLLCLTTPVQCFRHFTMNITAYLETPREAQQLPEYDEMRCDWLIQRSPERPKQYNLVTC